MKTPLNMLHVPSGDFPAFPESGLSGSVSGLTKREYFAGLAMQGVLANYRQVSKEKLVTIARLVRHWAI